MFCIKPGKGLLLENII
ncbi:hypothetical protein HID58_066681 [Brassica napus]|uniref:Uncharacterized protein n=1 Tax=Brassica napus TaxID=3708 RepID=A0ABQ7ZGB8_BRANA|nr:hypothetical protein HID58_066681 [Brassica napus]